jgi:hypothetical protein
MKTESECRGFSRFVGNHPGTSCGGAAVSPEAGVDVELLNVPMANWRSNPTPGLTPFRFRGNQGRRKRAEMWKFLTETCGLSSLTKST